MTIGVGLQELDIRDMGFDTSGMVSDGHPAALAFDDVRWIDFLDLGFSGQQSLGLMMTGAIIFQISRCSFHKAAPSPLMNQAI